MKRYQISASIVVFRNDPAEVAASIRSVMTSPLRVRCTVVDNSPTPDLRDTTLESGADYIFTGKNLGFGHGHNLVLRQNSDATEFHLIQNPDIYFSREVLPELYGFMEEHQDVGLVMPKILYPDGSDQHLCRRLPAPHDLIIRRFLGRTGRAVFKRQLARYELSEMDRSEAWQVPCLSGCFMFVRSSVLKEVGLFDERYFMYMEDFDLCRRIGRRAKTVYYPHVSVKHGYAKGSYVNLALLRHHLRSSIRYFSKWGWCFDRERKEMNRTVTLFRADEG